MEDGKQMEIKTIGYTPKRSSTLKKILDKGNGVIPKAAIVSDIIEKVAKGELVYSNGRNYFE